MIVLNSKPLTPQKLHQTITEMPSIGWFAVRALQGFDTAKALIETFQFKDFKQIKKPPSPITCWRCNGDIHHPVNDGWCRGYTPTPKFNDHFECRGQQNKNAVFCAGCEATTLAAYHPNFLLNALYTEENAYQLTLDEDLISFLMDPPPPPFVFCKAEAKSQHIVWMANYTLDPRYLNIHRARDSYLVDRAEAWALATDFASLLRAANELREQNKKIALSTPLQSDRKTINQGGATNLQISPIIVLLSKPVKDDPAARTRRIELKRLIDAIENQSFSMGTWWVAAMYLKAQLTAFHPKPIADWKLIKKPEPKRK